MLQGREYPITPSLRQKSIRIDVKARDGCGRERVSWSQSALDVEM